MEIALIKIIIVFVSLLQLNCETVSESQNDADYKIKDSLYITPENVDEVINASFLSSMQTLKLSKKPFSFVVEGIVGAGKTTMLSAFAKYPYIDVLPEPIEKWKNLEGYDMLNLTLTNPSRWGLTQEMYGILTVLGEHLRSVGIIRGMERSVHSARFIFTESFRMMGKMSNAEYTVLDQWYRLLNNEMNEAPSGFDLSADLIVYLQTDPKVAFDRIKKRGRPEEKGIQLPFLESLHAMHENWLIHKNLTHSTKIPARNIIVINTNHNFATMTKLYQQIAFKIWNMIPSNLKSACNQQNFRLLK